MTRIDLIHQARVYLRESRQRNSNPAQRSFAFTLLRWAGECRKRAAAMRDDPDQLDLFGVDQ